MVLGRFQKDIFMSSEPQKPTQPQQQPNVAPAPQPQHQQGDKSNEKQGGNTPAPQQK